MAHCSWPLGKQGLAMEAGGNASSWRQVETLNLTQLEWGFAVEVLGPSTVGRWIPIPDPVRSGFRVNPGCGPFVMHRGQNGAEAAIQRLWKP